MLHWLTSYWDYTTTTVIFTFLFVLYVTRWFLENRQLPPGPYGLPIVGYLPFAETKLEKLCGKLQQKYGDIFSFALGSRLTIVLGSWDSIKEALIKNHNVFSGRPINNGIGEFYDYNNVIAVDGESFNIQKRFMLSSLRDYGIGKVSIEGKIQEEAQAMIDLFQKNNCQPMDVQHPFNIMTANVICSIAFGERFEYEDKRMKILMDYLGKVLIILGEAQLVEAFPVLRYLPDKWNGLSNLRKMKKEIEKFLDEIIDEHIATFDKRNLRDLTDNYLSKLEENGLDFSDKQNPQIFSRQNVLQNLLLTFFAGTETTATLLSWAVKYLITYPEVQEKVRTEIDAVVGRSRLPSWSDRKQLPYTEATICEIHRMASITPFGVVHANTDEVYLKGYRIPKRTDIITNILNVHYDPKLWKNPEEFDPTRFLDSNGKVVKPEYLIPFSTGKRMCLGEPLARMEILIFFASFLQNFIFRCVGETPDIKEEIYGIVRKPTPYDVIVEPRN